ncbi:hypothetical protein CR513_01684, partial [Mucuna pruriens]
MATSNIQFQQNIEQLATTVNQLQSKGSGQILPQNIFSPQAKCVITLRSGKELPQQQTLNLHFEFPNFNDFIIMIILKLEASQSLVVLVSIGPYMELQTSKFDNLDGSGKVLHDCVIDIFNLDIVFWDVTSSNIHEKGRILGFQNAWAHNYASMHDAIHMRDSNNHSIKQAGWKPPFRGN